MEKEIYNWLISTEKIRVDKFIADKTGKSRKKIKDDILKGLVSVNSKNTSPDYKIRVGDKISYTLLPPENVEITKENIPLNIIYNDKDILIINKPAGLIVHPGAGNFTGTLVNALLYHFDDWNINGNVRPGIVHRLDKNTSGLLIVARNDKSQIKLVEMFKNREMEKTYIAIVRGRPPLEGIVSLPIGRDPGNRLKFTTGVKNAKESVTLWKVVEYLTESSLLQVVIKTGRTHQIRVHLTGEGYPVVGDIMYKRKLPVKNKEAAKILSECKRQALHAWKLKFNHPVTGKILEFEAPIPDDMKKLIEKLRNIK